MDIKKSKERRVSNLKGLVDTKLNISITRQTKLLGINRPSLYYKKRQGFTEEDKIVISRMQDIYSACPFYGFRKILVVLIQEGFVIGKKVKAIQLNRYKTCC